MLRAVDESPLTPPSARSLTALLPSTRTLALLQLSHWASTGAHQRNECQRDTIFFSLDSNLLRLAKNLGTAVSQLCETLTQLLHARNIFYVIRCS